ncbi:COG1361 S-layer family protein [Haloprofundus salinisoli]|uniref:COG1361 S-layer family protein n=1 Tax=Haloprofundus salinisoli TaxID=2876193 RepID=UPI001CD010B5|nr:COG1361 S-layer family protein [Haloprofundus salinisoli]
MRRKALSVLLVLALLTTPSTVSAIEDPRFEVYVPEPTLTPGEQSTLGVQLVNDAEDVDEQVRNARNVQATLRSGGTPITVRSGARLVGTMQDGQPANLEFQIGVPNDIESGTYDLALDLTYEYDSDERTTETVDVTVRVDDRARFVVTDVETDAPAGGSGTMNVTMRNVGESVARNASVAVQTTNADVRFGESESASRFVQRWEPGETRTLQYDVTVAGNANPGAYTMRATTSYENGNGERAETAPVSFGVTPLAEQTFELENVEGSLYVGKEGSLSGELVNTGETAARNVVLVFESQNANVNPVETEYALGTLEPGERAAFDFSTEVTDNAAAGPRQFSLEAKYRTADGTQRTSDPLDVQVDIGERRDEFDLRGVNATFAAGESGELVVELTNNRDEPLRQVSAKIFPESPISTDSSEAYVDELAPGESAELVFGVSVGGDALAKTYPVQMDFRYEDASGNERISDTYRLPVGVTNDEGGTVSLTLVGVGAIALVGVGAVLYRRRTGGL